MGETRVGMGRRQKVPGHGANEGRGVLGPQGHRVGQRRESWETPVGPGRGSGEHGWEPTREGVPWWGEEHAWG